MIRPVLRAARLGAALGALIAAHAASATVYSFDFTSGTGSAVVAASTFSSTVSGSTLKVKATAWHATDPDSTRLTRDAIASASLGIYGGAGLGVLYGSDSASTGTHQIDNTGSDPDFVMLQFDQDVTLSGISRNVYSLNGGTDSDAAWWADTDHYLGTPSATTTINLASGAYALDESLFTGLAGGSSNNTASLGTSKSASVWLISAALNQSNDGFKLAGLTATTPTIPNNIAAVPEPASWAMMLAGFFGVGATVRRHRAGGITAAARAGLTRP